MCQSNVWAQSLISFSVCQLQKDRLAHQSQHAPDQEEELNSEVSIYGHKSSSLKDYVAISIGQSFNRLYPECHCWHVALANVSHPLRMSVVLRTPPLIWRFSPCLLKSHKPFMNINLSVALVRGRKRRGGAMGWSGKELYCLWERGSRLGLFSCWQGGKHGIMESTASVGIIWWC